MKYIRSSFSSLIDSAKSVVLAKENRVFFMLYILVLLFLFFYSFTQIDLGLTITRNEFLFNLTRSFQYIGYFNRSLSMILFIVLLGLFFACYLWFMRLVVQRKLQLKHIIGILFFITPLLAFSYNAFSYDLFNYIFDAKIFTFYNENPYLKKALDFPTDPMLGFMHWTHRVYPYGPVWLLLSLPLSYMGLQYFIVTLVLFKLLALTAFVLTAIGIYKIVEKLYPTQALVAVSFFALNPLVLIESLLSAHNDIVMMGFALWSVYYLLQKKYTLTYLLLFLSIGVKFATIFLLPIFLYVSWLQVKKKSVAWEKVFLASCIVMMGAIIAAVVRPSLSNFELSINSTFQPWYLLFALPFASLLSFHTYIRIPLIIISFTALLNYAPYLYLGNYDPPVPMMLNAINWAGIVLGVGTFLTIIREKIPRSAGWRTRNEKRDI